MRLNFSHVVFFFSAPVTSTFSPESSTTLSPILSSTGRSLLSRTCETSIPHGRVAVNHLASACPTHSLPHSLSFGHIRHLSVPLVSSPLSGLYTSSSWRSAAPGTLLLFKSQLNHHLLWKTLLDLVMCYLWPMGFPYPPPYFLMELTTVGFIQSLCICHLEAEHLVCTYFIFMDGMNGWTQRPCICPHLWILFQHPENHSGSQSWIWFLLCLFIFPRWGLLSLQEPARGLDLCRETCLTPTLKIYFKNWVYGYFSSWRHDSGWVSLTLNAAMEVWRCGIQAGVL